MRNDELLSRIMRVLAQLITEIKLNNGASKMDINTAAEDFYCGLLNIILGTGTALRNMNRIHEDFPAIDLGDPEKGIAVQVTATESRDKVRITLKKFFERKLDLIYPKRLIILVTGRADDYSKGFNLEREYDFDPSRDVWDEKVIGREIRKLDLDQLEKLDTYLAQYFPCQTLPLPILHLPAPASAGVDSFVGRELEIIRIQQAMKQGVNPIVLSGLGGIGKTELVAEFSRKYTGGNSYFVTFRGSFTKTPAYGIAEGIHSLPAKLSEYDACKIALEQLRQCDIRDILIIDNVDQDGNSFGKLKKDPMYRELCGLPLRLILTTRFDVPHSIQVGNLKQEELYQIFENHGVSISQEEMNSLIQAVDSHTMTIDLMARLMVGSWRKVTAAQLLRALTNQNLNQFQREISTNRNRDIEQRRIYDHLKVLFDLVEMPDAAKSVMVCATLLPEGGMDPESFGSALPLESQNSLDNLIQHGWLNVKSDLLTIHPVIRLVCREEIMPEEENCSSFLTAISVQFDESYYDAVRYQQWAELFTKAAKEVPHQLGKWEFLAGLLWHELGKTEEALIHLLRVVALQEAKLEPNSIDLATTYNNIGNTYSDLGDYEQALKYNIHALSILEQVLPKNHITLSVSYSNVGSTYSHLGKHKLALNYLLNALAIQENILPEGHVDLSHTYNSIGGIYGNLNNHTEALQYMFKALAIREREYPENHPLLASSYNNVGFTFGNLGDYETALKYKLKALNIQTQVLPEDHPDLALSYNNVGFAYNELGEYQKALDCLMTAINIQSHALPQTHPDLILSYCNASEIYGNMGDHQRELEYLMKALDIRLKMLPQNHPDIAKSFNNIGIIYGKLGALEKQLECILKALDIWEQSDPKVHADLAVGYGNAVAILISLNHIEDAAKYAHRSAEHARQAFPGEFSEGAPFPQFTQIMEYMAEMLDQGISPNGLLQT